MILSRKILRSQLGGWNCCVMIHEGKREFITHIKRVKTDEEANRWLGESMTVEQKDVQFLSTQP